MIKRSATLSNWRLNVILAFFLISYGFVDYRLFQIQVLNHRKYASLARNQYWDQETLPARRGDILSADGYILAGTRSNFLMYAEPKVIDDKNKFALDMATRITDLKYSDTALLAKETTSSSGSPAEEPRTKEEMFNEYHLSISKAVDQDLLWVPLVKNLTPPEKEELEKSGEKGIGFEEEPVRYYPEGNLASHVLGFVASDDNGEKRGYYGIEGSFNEDLKGKPGKIMEETDAQGAPILTGGYRKIPPVEGRDIELTINRSVQYIIERKLKEGVEKYNSKSGSVIVMDPSTGSILALANYPDYLPGDFSAKETAGDEAPHRKNIERVDLAISQTYEPGSVIKPFTVSSAIDLGLINPNTTYEDNGPVRYSDYYINNWDGKHYGTMTIIQLLQKSNNIGAAWVGHQVGGPKLIQYFRNFGIGTRTGVDLEGEDTGILHDAKDTTDIGLANISFGQGMSATPLQVLAGFNAFANGGYLLQPRIISRVIDGDKVTEIPTKNVRRVITEETATTMVDMLEKAVEGGEAKFFVLKNYRIAGKTGTAQIPEKGSYAATRTNATFVGFLAGSKRLSMIVKLEEPQTSIYAAETAVPLWMDMMSDLVRFYGIPADKEPAPVPTTQPVPTQVHMDDDGPSSSD